VAKSATGPLPLDALPFRLVSDVHEAGDRRLTWELSTRGLVIRKTFEIPDHGSLFRVGQEIVEDHVGLRSWGLSWAGGLRVTEDAKGRNARGYFEAAALAEGSVQRKKPGDARKKPIEFPGQTRFIGVMNKYFLAAIVPRGEAQGPARFWDVPSGEEGAPSLAGEILLERTTELATNEVQYDVYVGPQDYAALQSLGLGLEGAIDLGAKWVRPLSRAILATLIAVHRVIPNYGVTIILFSTLINLLFFPLTYRSTKSMRQMSALKPRLDALKEKHKDDAQKLSEATMRLYKEAGVNPLAGCLPLLLQMPIFFALYAVLFRTIELRQAPFVFWIHDLSQPDVVYHLPFALPIIGSGLCILPVIMGITSYFQSKQTMMDPSQQAMVVMMPVMMTFIFFSMPSGLVLYWLTTNVFTLVSKYFFKPEDDAVAAAALTVGEGVGAAAPKRTAKVAAKG
jgi:YidC/Oxa1 family membrane protein insertase